MLAKRISLNSLVFLELCIIILLIFLIALKQLDPFEKGTTELEKQRVIFGLSKKFKYYYEPRPNSIFAFTLPFEGLEATTTNKINRDGLNDRFDYQIKKDFGVYRIVTLGDSFTYGQFLKAVDNWTEQLEDKLNQQCHAYNKYEVINLGVPGYALAYETERFRLRGKKYDSDLVLWLVLENDFSIIEEKVFNVLAPKMNQKDPQTHKIVALKNALRTRLLSKFGLNTTMQYQKEWLYSFSKEYEKKLVLLHALGYPSTTISRVEESILKEYVEKRKDTYLHKIERDLVKSGGVFPDGHPNKKGHAVIAEDLFKYLTANNLISCASSKQENSR